MAHDGKLAESRSDILQAIVHIVEVGIGTTDPVDASEPANPVARLRERGPHMPAPTSLGAARKGRHCGKRHQVAGGVIERLRRQRFRLARASGLHFGVIEAASRLHQGIKAAPACPWAFGPIGAERNVDDPRPDARHILRACFAIGRMASANPLDLGPVCRGHQVLGTNWLFALIPPPSPAPSLAQASLV